LLEANGIDERRLEQLLREAEDSGDYTEMTAKDWEDIEREGLASLPSLRCSASSSDSPPSGI